MNLQQLRYLCAIVDHGLNVSDAAEALYTSQPGISKQIRQLEDELGLKVFVRQGKRLTALTPAGSVVLATARRALSEIGNLKRVADEYRREDAGTLTIATTHTQARYMLPRVLQAFAERYPKVRVVLHQGNPAQVAELTVHGDVDLGIATEALADFPDLVTLPCYTWNRCVLVPVGHPLAKTKGKLTLEALAKHPIITYDFAFTGRSQINAAFDARGLEPNVVLTALDADVIKTYVELGMGVGIVAQMAFDPARDAGLVDLPAAHLFAPSTTRLALRRDVFLRGYVYDFIARFAPTFDRATVDAALEGGSTEAQSRRATPGARDRRAALVVARRAARGAHHAGAVRDRHVPAGVPRDRRRPRRPAAGAAADAVGLPVRLRLHDAVARRAVRRARPSPGRARGARRSRGGVVRRRDRGQHRVAGAVPGAAGAVGGRRAWSSVGRSSATASTARRRSG